MPILDGCLEHDLSKVPALIARLADPSNSDSGNGGEKASNSGSPNDSSDGIDLHVFIWICVGIAGGALIGTTIGLAFAFWMEWI